jgi:hypothetical protein
MRVVGFSKAAVKRSKLGTFLFMTNRIAGGGGDHGKDGENVRVSALGKACRLLLLVLMTCCEACVKSLGGTQEVVIIS